MEVIYAEFTVKMKNLWLIIIAVLLFSCNGIAQIEYIELPKTNLNLYQEITSKSLNDLGDFITVAGKDKIFKVNIEDTTGLKEFFVNELKQKFQNAKFVYGIYDSVDYIIKFSDLGFKTAYTNIKTKYILGDEYVSRELIVKYKYSVSGKDINNKEVYKSYKDEINVDKLEYIESGNYAFLKAVLPEKPFLQKIIVPAVIVAVSAITAILFFTIRSK
jgi:hypothetical protein